MVPVMTYRSLFNADGLRAHRAATQVAAAGPLRWGLDGQFWSYRDGVWSPGENDVHGRVVAALGERYRPAHSHAIRDVLRATLAPLEVLPVPRYINVPNGMVDWRAEHAPRLIDHDPSFVSTVQLPVHWRPGESTCDEFDAFLEQSVPDDDRQRVWEILGYLMMSGNPLQKLFLLTGGGGNGKGVLLAVIHALLGRHNVSSVPLTDFADSQFATAEVFGRLANICGDIDTTYLERTGQIKALSGEDSIKGERKYGNPWYFEFWGKALFSANALPVSSDGTRGWLRRWEIVRFPFEPLKPDRGLKARLIERASLEAIAVRAVLALRDLMERERFDHGDSATEAHHEFAVRNNRLMAWIEEEGYMDSTSRYERRVLYNAYRFWESGSGGRAVSDTTFYERIGQIPGVRTSRSKGRRLIWGVRLNRDAVHVDLMGDDPPEPEGGADTRVDTERLF